MREPDFDMDFDGPDFQEPNLEFDHSEFDANVKQFKKRTKEIQERGGEFKKGLDQGFIKGQEAMSALHNDWKKWVMFLGVLLFVLVLYKLTRA